MRIRSFFKCLKTVCVCVLSLSLDMGESELNIPKHCHC